MAYLVKKFICDFFKGYNHEWRHFLLLVTLIPPGENIAAGPPPKTESSIFTCYGEEFINNFIFTHFMF